MENKSTVVLKFQGHCMVSAPVDTMEISIEALEANIFVEHNSHQKGIVIGDRTQRHQLQRQVGQCLCWDLNNIHFQGRFILNVCSTTIIFASNSVLN